MDEVIDVVPEKTTVAENVIPKAEVIPTVKEIETSPPVGTGKVITSPVTGIASTSPVIEKAVPPIRGTLFRHCIEYLLAGKRMRRQEWSNDGTYITMRDEKLVLFKPQTRTFHPLILSSGDMAGEDWVVVRNE